VPQSSWDITYNRESTGHSPMIWTYRVQPIHHLLKSVRDSKAGIWCFVAHTNIMSNLISPLPLY
jgi:hypothetical protein